jgi:uncharacterized protein YceK
MRRLVLLLLASSLLSGCAVVMVTGAAVGLASTGVGLATDAAVGTVRLTGKAAGAVIGTVLPDNKD